MEDFSPIQQDIDATCVAFERDDFRLMNIFSNRAMSNAALFAGTPIKYWMTSFFLKDVAVFMLSLAARKTASVATAKAVISPYVNQVRSRLPKDEFELARFWETYVEYANQIRKFVMDEIEEKVYTPNKRFATVAANWLLDYLQREKQLLTDSRNMLLEGIINEMGRIFLAHGADLREFLLLSIIEYLQKINQYAHFASARADGTIDSITIEKEIFPFIERIAESFPAEKPPDIEEASEILRDILLHWRYCFIRYTELRVPSPSAGERGIELPEETRKKITEAITKSLVKETGR